MGPTAVVSVQDPVWLDDHTEALPDIALLRPRPDYYRNGRPAPGDVLLIIEVADSSLADDRDVKLPRDARAGIPEAWLVDLDGRRLLRHCRPAGTAYAEAADMRGLTAAQLSVTVPGGVAPTIDLRALF